MKKYDFKGWATRNNIKCSDGRTILKDAFIENDGMTVPLVWNHQHNEPENVLGHALLENRPEGVYAYCTFNDTRDGAIAKALVQHRDVNSLSIYANQLKQDGSKNVMHGIIREVSLVLAGANPGAYIEDVIEHADGSVAESEAVVWNDPDNVCIELPEDVPIAHSDKEDKDENEEEETKEMDKKERTVQDIVDGMSEEEQKVMFAFIGAALAESKKNNEGENDVKHNVFDYDEQQEETVLTHDAMETIFQDGKRLGSLRESFLAHAQEYGIENFDFVKSEDKNFYDRPQFIRSQPVGWISTVINGVHHTPFANVRTIFADITEDDARAKGYIKGEAKKDEVFKLLKRSLAPTTIYKKQKFDRDDLIDADFDTLPWVKEEMEVKFDEEKARAYIFGDGRSNSDPDKIKEDRIVPVIKDDDLFTIKVTVTPEEGQTLEDAIIDNAILAQDDYQGSGNLIGLFAARRVSKMLIQKDKFGHRLYKTIDELAAAMGLQQIVKVPAGVVPEDFYGVMLDLDDYNVGEKNMGKKSFFEDFDIVFNQQHYLLEQRQSGGLIRPYSAIYLKAASNG
ncbi:MAG: phage major capsid protein [Pseudobutyrivibrio sp.]|nr:phage major capsid protein [Pseudobutyrivibrio sp.]